MKQVKKKIADDLVTGYRNVEVQLEELKQNSYGKGDVMDSVRNAYEVKRNLTQAEIDRLWLSLQQARATG
jgi:hypothetical protein